MKEKKQFRKNFIWNILGTGFNAFNSLFFLIIVTRINGVNDAGIFTIAFSTACILYIIGVYAGRIYQVTEPDKTITDKVYIVNRLVSTIGMIFIVIIFCLIKNYSIFKTTTFILLTVYKAIEAFSDVIYGILQKNEKLETVGKSLFIKSLISIIVFLIIDLVTKNILFSILAIIAVNIIILMIYDIKSSMKYINNDIKEKITKDNVFKIFRIGFYTFAIAFLGMYVLNAPKYAIDNYLEDNYQTIFGIVVMPATVIGLAAQFLIHPYLNEILKIYKNRDKIKLNKLIFKLIIYISSLGILSSLLAYFLGPEVLGLIYGIDLTEYRIALLIIIIASTIYTIGVIYSSILTAIRETVSQLYIYIYLSVFAFIVSTIMTKYTCLNGAVYSYFLIMFMQFLIYTIYTNIKLKIVFNKEKNK